MTVAADNVSSALEVMQSLAERKAAEEVEAKRVKAEGRQLAFELLFVNGLYASGSTSGPVGAVLDEAVRGGSFGFDAYCITCRRETTFRVGSKDLPNRGVINRVGVTPQPPSLFSVSAVCQRDWTVYTYIIKEDDAKESLTKVGQYPSMAEIAFGELRAIDRSLDEVDRRELGKALGLHAHDTALGAFVYLRRVFERMILRAYERQAAKGGAVEGFDGLPMDKRIAALKDELPERVVQNSAVFSVLSVGIHELTEEQCTRYFPVLKAVLFQMLEQEEHKRKAAITARETDTALQRVLSDLNGATTD